MSNLRAVSFTIQPPISICAGVPARNPLADMRPLLHFEPEPVQKAAETAADVCSFLGATHLRYIVIPSLDRVVGTYRVKPFNPLSFSTSNGSTRRADYKLSARAHPVTKPVLWLFCSTAV